MSEFPEASQIGNLILSLTLVVGAIVGCLWLIKRLSNINQPSGAKLKVLASMSLGTRERALLVQAGDTQMLLGIAPGRVSQLHVFAEPVITENDAESSAPFAAQLASLLPKGKARE